MGMGNKLSPAMIEVADIYETSVDPLARVMRGKLRKLGVESLKVVYSKEEPRKIIAAESGINNAEGFADNAVHKRVPPGSTAFVPGTAGLIIASEVVKDIILMNP
jgi:tRNA A37 threonylcarbamoyladenosine dehydratase